MKKLTTILVIAFVTIIISCTKKGTNQVISSPDPNLEITKYFYEDGEYIFIAKYKNGAQKTESLTWKERHGKVVYTRGAITIYESDSI